jgi:competence protein ComEA
MAQWIERYRGFLLFALVVLVIAVVVLIQVYRPVPQPLIPSTATIVPTHQASSTPAPLQVYVSGAVLKPDVYQVPPGSIVKDALLAAGGAVEDADLDRINLASPVSGGQHIYVPTIGEENLPVSSPSRQSGSDGKVNINTADAALLETLPGIGPSLAQRIIDYRQKNGPFAQNQDIMEVSGIGQGIFDKLVDLIATD